MRTAGRGALIFGAVALSAATLFGQPKQVVKEHLNRPPIVQTLKDKPLAEPPAFGKQVNASQKVEAGQNQASLFATHSVFAVGLDGTKTQIKDQAELEKAKTSPGVKAIEYRDNSTGSSLILPPPFLYFPPLKLGNQPVMSASDSTQLFVPITDIDNMSVLTQSYILTQEVDTTTRLTSYRSVNIELRPPSLTKAFLNGTFAAPDSLMQVEVASWFPRQGEANRLRHSDASVYLRMLRSYMRINYSNGTPGINPVVYATQIVPLGMALGGTFPTLGIAQANATDSGKLDCFVFVFLGLTYQNDSIGSREITRATHLVLIPKHIAQAGFSMPRQGARVILGFGHSVEAGRYASNIGWSWQREILNLYLGSYQKKVSPFGDPYVAQVESPFVIGFVTPPTGVEGPEAVPATFSLGQNYPNPFNPSTRIRFEVPKAARVSIKVYDILGREVAVLADGSMPPGTYETVFNASGLPSGIYLCRMDAEGFTSTKGMVLLK